MKKILIATGIALLPLGIAAQTEVEPFVPGSTLEGVNYFLPKTALRIVVETEKTVFTPGDLNAYAFHYLRLNKVGTQPETHYSIKGIQVIPYGVVDNKKGINIKVKSKTTAPLVTLSPEGILLSVNKEVNQPSLPALPTDVSAPAAVNPRDFMTQEMLVAGSISKMAELCAQEIYDLRESRNALIRGEAENTPKDGAQLRLMLERLDQQIGALESLFKGRTATSTEYKVLTFVPEREEEQILFRFSKHLGLVEGDDLAGAPIYIKLSPLSPLPTHSENPEVDKKKAKMEKGLYYNVPVREGVSIYNDGQTFFQSEFPFAQFGIMEILGETLFNKNAQTKVSFHPETGGIERLEQ